MNKISSRLNTDATLEALLATAALVTASIVVLIAVFLWHESWPMLRFDGWQRFFASDGWHPLEGKFSVMPMIVCSVIMTAGALMLAGPLGLLCALAARFYAPTSLTALIRSVLGLMAGIPSVVYGLWGLTVLVPLIAARAPPGASLFAGILILSLMVLPTVALMSEVALRAVPSGYLMGAAALGLSKKATIFRVVLPAVRGSLITAMVLAAGRAVGETMAVIMVAGNIVQIPASLFDPVRVLTANIAMEMAYAVGDHRASLFVSGFILIALVGFLALLASFVQGRRRET